MGVAIPLQQADIFGNRFGVFPNPALKNKDGTDRTWLDHTIEYLKTSNGTFRFLQLLERISKAVSLVLQNLGSTCVAFFDEVAAKLGLAWAMLTLPRLPEVTRTAWRAVCDWSSPVLGPVSDTSRAIVQKIHEIAEAMASWGYGLSLIFANSAIKNAADVPNLVSDVTDLTMASEDYSLAKKHLEYVNANHKDYGDLQQRFMDKMRESLIKIIKAIASVASGILGLLILAYGPMVPVPVLLGLSLTATIAAMSAYFFKETRAQESVEFFKFRGEPGVDGIRVN